MHLPSSNVGLILIRSRRWVVIRPAICSACRCLPYDFDDNHHGRRRCSSSSLCHLIVIGPTTMLPGGGGRWYRDILIVGIIPPFGGHGRMIKFRQFLHSSWSSRRSDFLPAALSHSDVVDYDAAPPPCCDASTARSGLRRRRARPVIVIHIIIIIYMASGGSIVVVWTVPSISIIYVHAARVCGTTTVVVVVG